MAKVQICKEDGDRYIGSLPIAARLRNISIKIPFYASIFDKKYFY